MLGVGFVGGKVKLLLEVILIFLLKYMIKGLVLLLLLLMVIVLVFVIYCVWSLENGKFKNNINRGSKM